MVSRIDGDGYGKGIGPLTTPIKPLKSGEISSPISSLITPEEKKIISDAVEKNFSFLTGKAKETMIGMLTTEIAYQKDKKTAENAGMA